MAFDGKLFSFANSPSRILNVFVIKLQKKLEAIFEFLKFHLKIIKNLNFQIFRMFTMLIDCGQSASSSGLHSGISTKETLNLEDSILHRGTISVYRAICRNTGSALFKVAVLLISFFPSVKIELFILLVSSMKLHLKKKLI